MANDVEWNREADSAVSLGTRLVGSQGFRQLFQDGMGLIEEAAAYLDGPGREESRDLERPVSLIYATESMRLTTRLMQVASWLLLQRAVNEGEMTPDQARQDKYRVKLDAVESQPGAAGFERLPQRLRDLIARSVRLRERVAHLDGMLDRDTVPADNAVGDQLDRLRAAFGEG